MSLAGTGVVAIWHDLPPEAKDDFYEWHDREHMPERVGIPGFRRGRRYVAVRGTPEFFNLYEADKSRGARGPGLPRPSQCADRMDEARRAVIPQCGSLDLPRGVHRGVGSGGVILTLRFDIDAGASRGRDRGTHHARPAAAALRKGIAGVHLCLADEAISKVETAEKKARAERHSCRPGSC